MTPAVSVILPVHNAWPMLGRVLAALSASSVRPHEILVVDDGSTDGSGQQAEALGFKVLRTPTRSGPGPARNIGAKAATGEILFFIDADVCVQPDTVERVVSAFADPTLDALIGSYDDDPASPDFLSQYKNLMHHFVHQTGRTQAFTFWSGCGAIRREVFLKYSGFDESYGRPAIEDIELGYRLVSDGRRVLLDHDLRVKHLKRWSFWGLVKTDVLDRGIPWTELILRDQRMPNDLNLQLSQRVSVALVYLMLGIAALCALYWRGYFLTPLFALLFFLLGRYWTDGARPRVVSWLMGAGGLLIVAFSWRAHMYGLIPLVLLSFTALLLKHRYEWDVGWRRTWARITSIVYALVALGTVVLYLPTSPLILGFVATLLLVLFLNNQFYVFLAAKRGRWFALAAVPFHLLYHFYNGLSFVMGLCRWAWTTAWSRKQSGEPVSSHGKS
jgi:glycosyltransferase involved in cell wall biosynthesis